VVVLPETRAHEGAPQQFWHTFRDVGLEARFRQCLAEVRPDIVHFQHVQGVSARLLALASGWPRLMTLHDYWFFCANSQLLRPDGRMCAGPRLGWNCVDCLTVRADLHWMRALRPVVALPLAYRNAYLRRMAQSVPVLLAPSEFLRQQYVRQGFPGERITVIDLGLDTRRLAELPENALPEPPPRPHFGFLGALAPHKGVDVLVRAFNQLPANVALTIFGSETAFPDYVARLKALATHPHIRFAGAVNYQQVGTALRQLDCLVVPSIWYENSPMVIQEAYGCGIPVVASRLGALAEKVRDGQTGRLFAPGDSADLARVLHELIEQPQQLAALCAGIRPGPTMQQHARQMLEIYQSARDAGRKGMP
jgi:glycosyltransferase involved in cell wall biosynthesis